MRHTPPAYLARVPDAVLHGRPGTLARWLDRHHLRPSLADVVAERARRKEQDR